MQEIRLGNLYGATGGNFAGNVYDKNGLSPTICASYGVKQPPAMHVEVKPVEVGYIENGTGKHQSNTVYDPKGSSPTITTITGGGTQQIKIVEIKQAIIDDTYANREERIYKDYSPSLRAERSGLKTIEVKQATKEGYIPCEVGGVADLNYPNSTTRRGRVQGNGQISPTLTTENIPSVLEPWIWEIDGVTYLIRIRKLTPKECWRLMDFTDEDFEKAEKVNSNTQLYKQAGNSIVKNVLCEVFKQMM